MTHRPPHARCFGRSCRSTGSASRCASCSCARDSSRSADWAGPSSASAISPPAAQGRLRSPSRWPKRSAARGLHVDVLSRGYGRRRSALPLLVDPERHSAGIRRRAAAHRARSRRAGLCCRRAVRGGVDGRGDATKAERGSKPASHLLDDGFQHRQLSRNVDILLLTAATWKTICYPPAICASHCVRRSARMSSRFPRTNPKLKRRSKRAGWREQVWRLRRQWKSRTSTAQSPPFAASRAPSSFFGPRTRRCELASPDRLRRPPRLHRCRSRPH